jgi:hypothetical protein
MLMRELLEHLGMKETVKAIDRHCTLETEEDSFDSRLKQMEEA